MIHIWIMLMENELCTFYVNVYRKDYTETIPNLHHLSFLLTEMKPQKATYGLKPKGQHYFKTECVCDAELQPARKYRLLREPLNTSEILRFTKPTTETSERFISHNPYKIFSARINFRCKFKQIVLEMPGIITLFFIWPTHHWSYNVQETHTGQ